MSYFPKQSSVEMIRCGVMGIASHASNRCANQQGAVNACLNM
jgi:hypothetical protein